jgi:hypothetical protein
MYSTIADSSGNLHNLMIGEKANVAAASNVLSGTPHTLIKVLVSVVAPGLSCMPVALLATVAVGVIFFFAVNSSFFVSFAFACLITEHLIYLAY